MFKSSLLSPLKHGFLTRQGGVSSAPYDSLSFVVNKGDAVENVRQNRQIALERLGLAGKELITVNQVHGTTVINPTQPWGFGQGQTPDADAIVTQNPNFVLGVFTADCVPVLLCDEPSQTIAAIHSGWKGTRDNIVQATVEHMKKLGAQAHTIKAAVGPCIFQENYEIGPEVYGEFLSKSAYNEKFFKASPNSGKYLFDLPGVVMEQLHKAGVGQVDMMDLNTYQMEEQFFSCRRSFHKGEPAFGCMLSAISLG